MQATTGGPTSRGEQTRSALLDAAERAFAAQGYQGASLRDIAKDAGARLSLVHYHFGSKEEFFRATILRRQPQLVALIADSFATVDSACSPASADLEQTVEAFLRPFLEVRVSSHHPLHKYVQMTSHLMSSYRVPELRDVLATLSEVTELFETRLRRLLPSVADSDFYAALYIMEASLIFMVQDPGFVDDLSHGNHAAATLDRLVRPMVRLYVAGLRGLRLAKQGARAEELS